jgi:hypothetical protein
VGYDNTGIQEFFAIGLDDRVYGQTLDAQGNPTSSYYLALNQQVV